MPEETKFNIPGTDIEATIQYYWNEDDGHEYVIIERVIVGEQDIFDIIDQSIIEEMENKLTEQFQADAAEMRAEARYENMDTDYY